MSVYDFSPFKNSNFAEPITYTAAGAQPLQINAVVFRHGAQKIDPRNSAPFQCYPIIIELDRNDITTIVPQEDKVSCSDACGVTKEYRVSKVLYSDAGCFKIGLGI